MSYPHLTPEATNACSRAAFAYHPDCYCIIRWAAADFPPRSSYYQAATKWLEAQVWRCTGETDRYVTHVSSDNGPELLRRLHEVLAEVAAGTTPDYSLLAPDHQQRLITSYLAHPLLPATALHKAVRELLPRLPLVEAQALQNELGWALSERLDEAHRPPAGGGWIASAPRTTREQPAFPVRFP